MGDDGIEWELEDLDGGVLYDVFYESTTMLAGRMLAQRRLAAVRGDRDGERRAEADRRGLLAARGKVGPTDREALVRAKRAADSERGARAGAVAPWHAVGGSLKVDVEGIWRDDIRPVVDAAERSDRPCTVFVGGQPGAGKTRATHLVRVSGLHDGPLLPVNGDDLRQYHPDYDRLCDEEPLAMPERTAKASAVWIRMTMEYADENGIPAIVEGTWRNAATVLDEAANAKRADGPRTRSCWPCRRRCPVWLYWNATTGTVRPDCRRVGRPLPRMTTRWRTCPPRSAPSPCRRWSTGSP